MYVVTGYVLWFQVTIYTSVPPRDHEAQSSWLVPGTHDDDGAPLPVFRMRAQLEDLAA